MSGANEKDSNTTATLQETKEHVTAPEELGQNQIAGKLLIKSYLVIALISFLILAAFAHSQNYLFFDLPLTQMLQKITWKWFALVMQGVSWIGLPIQMTVLTLAIVIFLYVRKWKWESVMTLGIFVGAAAVDALAKYIVNRPRPDADLVKVFTVSSTQSFPSGHVVSYVAFFGFLWFLSYRRLNASVWRRLLLWVLVGLIVLVGPSRVYLGAHWASDVIGGYLLGSLCLAAGICLYQWERIAKHW